MSEIQTIAGARDSQRADAYQETRSLPARQPGGGRQIRFLVMGFAAGYLVLGRAFAYLGVPGIYPGEILLLATAGGQYGWLTTFLSSLRLKSALFISVLLFLIWGSIEGIRGYTSGYPILDVAKGLPANYYPLLLFAGMSAGRLLSLDKLKTYHGWLTVATGVTGMAGTILFNRGILMGLPWAPSVPIVSGAALPPFCLLAYIALSKRLSRAFIAKSFPAVAALLIGGRAPVIATLGGLVVLAFRPNRQRFIGGIAIITIAGGLGLTTFSQFLPDFGGRSGRVTPRLIAARLVSVVSPEIAAELIQGTEADLHALLIDAADADWRRHLWSDTIDSLTSTTDWLTGHGYGPVLGDILPGEYGTGYGHDLRTPHSFVIYLLGYTGLIGCALYSAFLLAMAFEIMRCPPSFLKDALMATSVSVIVMALSGNLFETPFGAVPAYTGIGMLLAAAQRQVPVRRQDKRILATGGANVCAS